MDLVGAGSEDVLLLGVIITDSVNLFARSFELIQFSTEIMKLARATPRHRQSAKIQNDPLNPIIFGCCTYPAHQVVHTNRAGLLSAKRFLQRLFERVCHSHLLDQNTVRIDQQRRILGYLGGIGLTTEQSVG